MVTTPSPALQQLQIDLVANLGLSQFTPIQLINYQEPDTTQAATYSVTPFSIAPASFVQVDIGALVTAAGITTPMLVILQDVSVPGAEMVWSTVPVPTPQFYMAPSGFTALRIDAVDSGASLWVYNNNTARTAELKVTVVGT